MQYYSFQKRKQVTYQVGVSYVGWSTFTTSTLSASTRSSTRTLTFTIDMPPYTVASATPQLGQSSTPLLKYAKFIFQAVFEGTKDFEACGVFNARTSWCGCKRFMLTESGYMGFASRARKSDHVVLLGGAKMPFILRPRWACIDYDEPILHSRCHVQRGM